MQVSDLFCLRGSDEWMSFYLYILPPLPRDQVVQLRDVAICHCKGDLCARGEQKREA